MGELSLNPFEIRAELPQCNVDQGRPCNRVSIPLKSGLNCRGIGGGIAAADAGLNPFEIRAELPRTEAAKAAGAEGLNPFEIRAELPPHGAKVAAWVESQSL